MSRLDDFNKMKNHPYYGALFLKLKKCEINICIDFIQQNSHLDVNAWAFKVNRIYLDKSEKPKNLSIMTDILTSIK